MHSSLCCSWFMACGIAVATVSWQMPVVQAQATTIQVDLDTEEVPGLAEWGKDAKVLIEEWYPRFVNLMMSENYTPPTKLGLKFKKTDEGVAYTLRGQIVVSSHWVEKHPEDTGMVIHEMVHVIQSYPGRSGPGWVTEGIADYMRYGIYEGRPLAWFPLSPDANGYTKGYNVTAGFFLWLEQNQAPGIVAKLNAHMRQRTYSDEVFEKATGKPLAELWREYQGVLRDLKRASRKPAPEKTATPEKAAAPEKAATPEKTAP